MVVKAVVLVASVVVAGLVEVNVRPGISVGLKVVAGTGASVVVDVRFLSSIRADCAAKLFGQFSFLQSINGGVGWYSICMNETRKKKVFQYNAMLMTP